MINHVNIIFIPKFEAASGYFKLVGTLFCIYQPTNMKVFSKSGKRQYKVASKLRIVLYGSKNNNSRITWGNEYLWEYEYSTEQYYFMAYFLLSR